MPVAKISGWILLMMVILCLTGNNLYAKQDHPGSVRIAFFPNITHSQALVGQATGNFKKAMNKKIEWKIFNAGSSEIEAFMAGELDIGYIGPAPAINGYTKTRGDLQIIAGATNAGAVLVSRKDLIIKNLKQLGGKKVAIPQYGNTQDLSLRYILKQNGLKDKARGGTVEIVQVNNPDIKTLFDNKAIEAALVPEPWGTRLINETGARLVLDYNQIWRNGNYPTTIVIARKDFINSNPGLIKAFLKTHIELTDFINSHPFEAKRIVNQQIKVLTRKNLPQSVVDKSFKRMKIQYSVDKQAVLEFINLSVETGILKKRPDTSTLFNLKLLNEVLKKMKKKIAG